INALGDTAISTSELVSGAGGTTHQQLRMRLWRNGAFAGEDAVLGVGSITVVGIGDLGINALRFVSAAVNGPDAQQRVVMFVPEGISGLTAGTVNVAAVGGGGILQILEGTAINDQNTIAFGAYRDDLGTFEILVKDVGAPAISALRHN